MGAKRRKGVYAIRIHIVEYSQTGIIAAPVDISPVHLLLRTR